MGRLLSIYHYTLLNDISTAVCYHISAVTSESLRILVALGFDFGRQKLTPAGAGSSHPALRMRLEDKRCWMVSVIPWMLCHTLHSHIFYCFFPFPAPLRLRLGSQSHVRVSRLYIKTRLSATVALQ